MAKRLWIAMSILLLAVVGTTVSAQEGSIVGDWAMTAIGAGSESYSGDELEEIGRAGETLELTEDGEVTWTTNDSRESGTYTYDPESGSLSFDVVNQDDQPAEYQLVVDELTEERLVMSIPEVLTYTFERR